MKYMKRLLAAALLISLFTGCRKKALETDQVQKPLKTRIVKPLDDIDVGRITPIKPIK